MMESEVSKQMIDAAPNISADGRVRAVATSLALGQTANGVAPSFLLSLPPELFDIVANNLEGDWDFLNLRMLCHESKIKMRDAFRKRFASQLSHVDGSLTRSHLATLLALVTDNDTATEIQVITISSSSMSEAVLNWPEAPESYKERLRALMQAEHVGLDEGTQILVKVFSNTPSLPKLQDISIGPVSSRLKGTNQKSDLPMHHISTFTKHLGLDKQSPDKWQLDTGYTTTRSFVDELSRLDLTIVATLMALIHIRHIVESRDISIAVTLRDITMEDLWRRWASMDELRWMKAKEIQHHDPGFYLATIPNKIQASIDLLAKLREYSQKTSGSPDTAIELVKHLRVEDWTINPFSLLGISALVKHILYHARSITGFSILYIDHGKQVDAPHFPINNEVLLNVRLFTLWDVRIQGSALQALLRRLPSVRRMVLSRIELADNSWKDVFGTLQGLNHLRGLIVERLSVAESAEMAFRDLAGIDYDWLDAAIVFPRVNVRKFLETITAIPDCVYWDPKFEEDAVFFPDGDAWSLFTP